MKKHKGSLDREDDFNGGPVNELYRSPQVIDQVRDLHASILKLTEDRDNWLNRLQLAHEAMVIADSFFALSRPAIETYFGTAENKLMERYLAKRGDE